MTTRSEHDDDSDENTMPKKEEDESDNELKVPKDQTAVSRDSSLGASSSSHGIGKGASMSALVINPRVEHNTSMPLPTRLLSMRVLEELANNLYAYSGELFRGLEETSMAMLDRILSGFKKSGSCAREYIHETAVIAINFFSRAGDMEAELESSEALKFCAAVNGMKESIRDLVQQTTLVEESYEDAAAQFDNILLSISDKLKEFVEAQGEEQRQEYISKCLDRIRGIHGSLDGTQFILMVVTNIDYAPCLGIESEGESVVDSPPNYDLAYVASRRPPWVPGRNSWNSCQGGCWRLMLSWVRRLLSLLSQRARGLVSNLPRVVGPPPSMPQLWLHLESLTPSNLRVRLQSPRWCSVPKLPLHSPSSRA